MIFGPWKKSELYFNAGTGYHSNRQRQSRDDHAGIPGSTGESVDPVTPLARAKGAEVGFRTVAIPRVQTTLTLWRLDLASELIFAGDAGSTEASRPSEQCGSSGRTTCGCHPFSQWTRTWHGPTLSSPTAIQVGSCIPGAVQVVSSLGLSADTARRALGSVRLRYFGPRPLIEDNSIRSKATKSLVNGQVGYHLTPRWHLVVDVFNLFNAPASDIDYFYTSRLPGEIVAGVDDIHSHPTLPRTVRLVLRVQF